ncbi:helix-turn-helix domain-containing protein [Rhizobium sp. 007]|uniref:helix-turn-helix domain-containing protein n=1 Tax=Rhizobium sp. 007 TaxID=2785056 RepID=UPI00188E3163|nr:helix-turn-helix domain-containing protein [Rhizobium sp. 007]QPB21124.1 helix-turn-helix domain-containing protein [Rhizobium sp. 007]
MISDPAIIPHFLIPPQPAPGFYEPQGCIMPHLSKNDVLNIIDAAMLDHKRVKPSSARVLHIMIKDFRNSVTGACYPSVEVIAERCGLSKKAVSNSLAELKAAGYISWKRRTSRGKQTTNLYNFHLPGAAISEGTKRPSENASPREQNDHFRVNKSAVSEGTKRPSNPVEVNPVEQNPVTGVHSEPLSTSSLRSSEDDIPPRPRERVSQLLRQVETVSVTDLLMPQGVQKLKARFPNCDTARVFAQVDAEIAAGTFPSYETDRPVFVTRILEVLEEAERLAKASKPQGIFRDGFTGQTLGYVPPKECRELRGKYPCCDVEAVLRKIDAKIAAGQFPNPMHRGDFLRWRSLDFEEAERVAAGKHYGTGFTTYRQLQQWLHAGQPRNGKGGPPRTTLH